MAYGNFSAEIDISRARREWATEQLANPNGDWAAAIYAYQHPLQGMDATINLLTETMLATAGNIGNVGLAERVFVGGMAREVTTGTAGAGFFWFMTRKKILQNEDLGDVALGLWKHQGTGNGSMLDRFSKHVGARHFGDIFGDSYPTESILERLLHGATRLHVNLDGMIDNIDDINKIIEMGSKGIDHITNAGHGNITKSVFEKP